LTSKCLACYLNLFFGLLDLNLELDVLPADLNWVLAVFLGVLDDLSGFESRSRGKGQSTAVLAENLLLLLTNLIKLGDSLLLAGFVVNDRGDNSLATSAVDTIVLSSVDF